MTIRTTKLPRRALTLAPLMLLSTVLVTGCSTDHSAHSASTSAAATSADPAASTRAGNLSADDVMFLQMMIPHHEQALQMTALVDERTTNTGVRDLASEITTAQDPEITQMRALLVADGAPLTGDHAGHGMDDGMLTDEQINDLMNATGADFDRQWLEGMRVHHEGAISMAQDVNATTTNPQVRALADEIITAQTAEIEQIDALLAELP